ncbi:hypothetical protein HDU91_002245, partial [Kappamyces sp. JEL0680]
ELWNAIDLVGLKPYVTGIEDKLDAKVAAMGENLSVGQRQLLCLARAILMKPKILVMDEATAAIDGEADQLIQQALKSNFKDTTVISIAHRLQTIASFDKVLVLDQGVLSEFDSPRALLQRGPASEFYRLVESSGAANAQVIRKLAGIV